MDMFKNNKSIEPIYSESEKLNLCMSSIHVCTTSEAYLVERDVRLHHVDLCTNHRNCHICYSLVMYVPLEKTHSPSLPPCSPAVEVREDRRKEVKEEIRKTRETVEELGPVVHRPNTDPRT